MADSVVSIILGSDSDLPQIKSCAVMLEQFNIPFEINIASAHRSPELVRSLVKDFDKRGIQIVIAGAGGAAHLPGVIAAETTLPVIGVPMKTETLSGVDSLYSIVQMPKGIPVATVAIGEAGAANAAILAAEILALKDPVIKNKLLEYKKRLAEDIEKKSATLKKIGYKDYLNQKEN